MVSIRNGENSQGIATIAIVATLSALLVLGGTYFYFSNDSVDDDIGVDGELEQELKASLSDFGAKGILSISKQSENHLRGTISGRFGEPKPFLAVNTGGKWQIVEYDNESFSCERAFKLNFPPSMITDCVLENPNVVTVDDLLKKPTSEQSGQIALLGKLSKSDPDCNCIVVSSGGSQIEIPLPPEGTGSRETIDGLGEGDTVIINGTVTQTGTGSGDGTGTNTNTGTGTNTDTNTGTNTGTNNTDSSNTNNDDSDDSDSNNQVVIAVDDIEEVSPEDDDTADGIGDPDSGSDNNSDGGSTSGDGGSSSGGSSTGGIDDDGDQSNDVPNEPTGTSNTQSSGNSDFNIFDIDNSVLDVQLIND